MLRGLGLEVAHGVHRDQGDVDEKHVLRRKFAVHLSDGLKERHALDIADRAADLHHADLSLLAAVYFYFCRPADTVLDLVGDMGDDLDGRAEEVPAPLFLDDVPIDLSGRDIVERLEVDVQKPFVVAQVEVDLSPVGEDEDLPVLGGVHGAGIDVQIRVDLHRRYLVAAIFQEATYGGGGDAFPESAHDAAGYNNVLQTPVPLRNVPEFLSHVCDLGY